MSAEFKVGERVGWTEFILVTLVAVGGITGLIAFGNMNPDIMSVPIALGGMAAIAVLCTLILVIKNRKRILLISQSKWTLKDAKSGKVLMQFDLTRPYCLGFAIRQGLIGKYGKQMIRFMQVFMAQDGQVLRMESHHLEYQVLNGTYEKEWVADIKPPHNEILMLAVGKSFTFDEPKHLMEKEKMGMAAHGLPGFMMVRDDEMFRASLISAEQNVKQNTFTSRLINITGDDNTYSIFKKEFEEASASI